MSKKEIAEEILGRHLTSLGKIIQKGFHRYQQLPERHLHSPRSRASLIHDFIVHEAEKAFEMIKNVRCFYVRNLFLISFDGGRVVLRLKKIGEDFKASNHATPQSTLFDDPVQTELFGESVLLTAGYFPDQSFTSIQDMAVTYFSNNKFKWNIPIPFSREDNVVELPVSKEEKITKKKRVRSRGVKKKLRVRDNEGENS